MEKQNFILCQYSVKTKQLKKRSSELRNSILLDEQITSSLWRPQTKHVCINCLVSYYIEGKLKKHHVVFFENDRRITKFLGNDSFQLQSKNWKLPLQFRYFVTIHSNWRLMKQLKKRKIISSKRFFKLMLHQSRFSYIKMNFHGFLLSLQFRSR